MSIETPCWIWCNTAGWTLNDDTNNAVRTPPSLGYAPVFFDINFEFVWNNHEWPSYFQGYSVFWKHNPNKNEVKKRVFVTLKHLFVVSAIPYPEFLHHRLYFTLLFISIINIFRKFNSFKINIIFLFLIDIISNTSIQVIGNCIHNLNTF